MKNLSVHIDVSPDLYLKDPDSTELGRKIISNSIVMINELGFELFTFKKLGIQIESPESSVYRYFENKHSLLIYLVSWYWSWIEYQIFIATVNVDQPGERLTKAVRIVVQPPVSEENSFGVNTKLLSRIIITESVKAYHTKDVDDENRKGFFRSYKQVVRRLSGIVQETNHDFEYPHMLISTLIEGAHQQRYFAEHLPSLTDVKQGKDSIADFYTNMIIKMVE